MNDVDDYSIKGKQKDIDFILKNHEINGSFAVCAYVWDDYGDEHQYMFKVYRSEESGEIFLKSRWDTELYTVDEFTYYYDFYHEVFNIEDWF